MNVPFARAVAVVLCLVASSCGSDSASAPTVAPPGLEPSHGDPRTAAWGEIVASLDAPPEGRPTTSCERGEAACLLAVVEEMEVRLAERPCAHTAPFAFTYLEMTRGVLAELDAFDDPALVSVIDARFAQAYFDAFDSWDAGRTDDVPAAWQLAFATADRGESPAAVDLLLGMNAHISRDLAYIVERVLAGFDESPERIGDFEQVNEVIGGVKSPMLEAAADRFDPSLLLLDIELAVGEAPEPLELIAAWRSIAFDLGRRLGEAPTSEARIEVVAEIERQAAAGAAVVVAMEAGTGSPSLAPARRDDYCQEQLDQRQAG